MMGLHALAERVAFAALGEWEVRRHPESKAQHAYFAPRGFLHLQLWHSRARVSVLTPSRLTNDRFEIWRDGIRIVVRCWGDVVAHLADVTMPGAIEVEALWTWAVARDEASARSSTHDRERVGA